MDPGSRKIAELLHTERPQNPLETYASTFAVSFVQSLYEEPSFAVKQALAHMRPGQSGEKLAAQVEQSRPKEIETETLSTNWLAKVTGSALGQLPLLLLTHRASGALMGKAERIAAVDLEKTLGKTSRDLINTGMTGFAYGSVFTPTSSAALANGDFWTNRGLHGLSNGIAFSAMHFSMNKLTAKSVDGNLTPTFWQKPMVAGGLSGIPSGFFATETNSLIDRKRLARQDELVDGIATQCVLGSGFARSEAKLRECSSAQTIPARELNRLKSERNAQQHELLMLQEKFDVLKKENEKLTEISAIDGLTGLKNQRAGMQILDTEFARSSRAATPLSVLFLDLNGFKKVNDALGHDVGNNALVKSADLISQRLRKSDTLFRNGGDEFVVILPDTAADGALRVAKDIQSHLRFELSASDGTKYPIGTSIGASTFEPLEQNFADANSLLREADQNMYTDKRRIKGNPSSDVRAESARDLPNSSENTETSSTLTTKTSSDIPSVIRVADVFVEKSGALITPTRATEMGLEGKTASELAEHGISKVNVNDLPIQDIVNPIDKNAPPLEKLNQLRKLSLENQPLVEQFKRLIDSKYGTYSYGDPKQTETILKKPERPDTKQRKPWFSIEHVRDSQRFTTIVDNLNDLPHIARDLKKSPFQIVEANLSKLEPNGRGWRTMPFDLRAPNGQLLEYQVIPREMYEAGRETHPIYNKWRDLPAENLSPEQKIQRRDDLIFARQVSQKAWSEYLKRTGQTEEHIQEIKRKLCRALMEGSL